MTTSSSKDIEIKFGGTLHEIDADVLIESLVSYSAVTQEAANYLSPKGKVNIKIKAPKKGSFLLLLNIVAEGMETLFDTNNLNAAATVVGLVADLYSFKKWISKNGKPKTIKHLDGSVEVTGNKNSTILVDNRTFHLYQDSARARENMRKTFTKLKDAKEISDFSINVAGENLFNIEKKDFLAMSSEQDEIERERQAEIKEKQELSVFKIVFGENYKWEFFYQGNRIYASMKDKEFFENINKGKVAFRSGDKIIANMEIERVFNDAANTFVNDSYSILKVIEHIPRDSDISEQTSVEIGPMED